MKSRYDKKQILKNVQQMLRNEYLKRKNADKKLIDGLREISNRLFNECYKDFKEKTQIVTLEELNKFYPDVFFERYYH